MTTRILNCRQAHWNISLSRFNFVITYRPGNQQGLSHALSRRLYLAPKEGETTYEQQWTSLLKAEQLRLRATTMSNVDYLMSYHNKDHNLSPNFGDPSLKSSR
jgi:hypothetical protein